VKKNALAFQDYRAMEEVFGDGDENLLNKASEEGRPK
jgi:hypothetical protein